MSRFRPKDAALRMTAVLCLAALATAACSADAPTQSAATDQKVQAMAAMEPDPGDPGGGDPGGGGESGPCLSLGATCIASIATAVPACITCETVVTCVICAGAVATGIAACGGFYDQCVSTAPHEGDPCRMSNRCESGSMHCVDNHCSTEKGHEPQDCSTDRDCADGLTCLQAADGAHNICFRLRGAGEHCEASAECQTNLVCDPSTHNCRAHDPCEIVGTSNCTCIGRIADGCVIRPPGGGGPSNPPDPPPPPPPTICIACASPGCYVDYACGSAQYCNGSCPADYTCQYGGCVRSQVTICNCDGTDPPGTCDHCDDSP